MLDIRPRTIQVPLSALRPIQMKTGQRYQISQSEEGFRTVLLKYAPTALVRGSSTNITTAQLPEEAQAKTGGSGAKSGLDFSLTRAISC